MDDEIYDNLPDDNEQAFLFLEQHYKRELEQLTKDSAEETSLQPFQSDYANSVIAAAIALDIEAIKNYELSLSDNDFRDDYQRFSNEVMNLTIRIRIKHSRRKRSFSVSLSSAEKQKIQHYVEQIRLMVVASHLPSDKKDSILKKLSELTLEIDRDRTRFEIFADGLRSVARLSGDIEREGAEPWWKWVKLIFGVVDDAKEREEQANLPSPTKREKLEAPRKQIPGPKPSHGLDDDIPF